MTRALVQIGVIASVLLALAGCGKKRAVERRDFEEVNEHVQKDMRGDGVSAEKRLDYVISKLGAPHHTSGGSSYWYSPKDNCYYLQVGEDGWTSWGVGVTSDCAIYGVAR
jgi:hypothetical protein